jgi:hypothetical protein
MVMVEAVSEGEREPWILRLVEVREPLLTCRGARERAAELVFSAPCLHPFGHPELEGATSESPQLLVGTEDEDVDPRHHPRDSLVGDPREELPAELVEDEVGAVAEVVELEVVLHDAVETVEQAVVGPKEEVGGAEPAALRDDHLVLELGQVGHLELVELPEGFLHLLAPPLVELVPVRVVEATAAREQLGPSAQHVLVRDRIRAEVEVAVENAVFDAERRRNGEEPSVRLVQRGHAAVDPDGVERIERLGAVDAVVEPEPGLVEVAAVFAEGDVVGVHLLPPFAGSGNRDVERAREVTAPTLSPPVTRHCSPPPPAQRLRSCGLCHAPKRHIRSTTVEARSGGWRLETGKTLGLGNFVHRFGFVGRGPLESASELGSRPNIQLAVGAGEMRLDRAEAHEELGGDFLVRSALCGEPCDPPLRLGQVVRGRRSSADSPQLRPRLLGPEPRSEVLEDGERLLERVTSRSPLLRLPSDHTEAKTRAPALEGPAGLGLLAERTLECSKRTRRIALSRGDETATAGGACDRTRAFETSRALLVLVLVRPSRLDLAEADERLDRVGPEREGRVAASRRPGRSRR